MEIRSGEADLRSWCQNKTIRLLDGVRLQDTSLIFSRSLVSGQVDSPVVGECTFRPADPRRLRRPRPPWPPIQVATDSASTASNTAFVKSSYRASIILQILGEPFGIERWTSGAGDRRDALRQASGFDPSQREPKDDPRRRRRPQGPSSLYDRRIRRRGRGKELARRSRLRRWIGIFQTPKIARRAAGGARAAAPGRAAARTAQCESLRRENSPPRGECACQGPSPLTRVEEIRSAPTPPPDAAVGVALERYSQKRIHSQPDFISRIGTFNDVFLKYAVAGRPRSLALNPNASILSEIAHTLISDKANEKMTLPFVRGLRRRPRECPSIPSSSSNDVK
ncbi:hypothetical protein EVAR_92726_1 [Eumeta japonica]|uniref:Uncharacterized protein n=1 Tax=Eumeta variegata TaxID=151549 RepID=A0A4C1SX97_EUMVA|nr:hypothetical protein EVAR_92726_1 [Eumeta japonica]